MTHQQELGTCRGMVGSSEERPNWPCCTANATIGKIECTLKNLLEMRRQRHTLSGYEQRHAKGLYLRLWVLHRELEHNVLVGDLLVHRGKGVELRLHVHLSSTR